MFRLVQTEPAPELDVVRCELERLVALRFERGLTLTEARVYEHLADREADLLRRLCA